MSMLTGTMAWPDNSFASGVPFGDRQTAVRPYEVNPTKATTASVGERGNTSGGLQRRHVPPLYAIRNDLTPIIASRPIQIWEGTVHEVDLLEGTMEVVLEAKMGEVVRHAATISLEWVTPQDKELVVPGAVFYLSLYRQSERTTIKNAEEIRFRRMPSWSKQQIKQIQKDAEFYLSRIEP